MWNVFADSNFVFFYYHWQASLGIVLGLFVSQVSFSKDSFLVILCSKFSGEPGLENLCGYSVSVGIV